MNLLFWISALLIVYAYVGYPIVLLLFCRARPIHRAPLLSAVTIVIAARNEEHHLPGKLSAIRALDYPPELLETIVVSDGSTDRTASILTDASHGIRLVPVVLPESVGKAEALNRAVPLASGEILVFLDTRQSLDPAGVRELVSCFADRKVGAASGELMLEAEDGSPSADALGIYWKIEKLTRKLESETGSVVGVTGAIYAMRRELYCPIPRGTLLDDVLIPMQVARAGHRVVFHSGAIARDRVFADAPKEFGRKVRTLTGNYQLLRLAPWLLSPENPLLFRLISHKLLRLLVPFLLIVLLVTSALSSRGVFHFFFAAQLLFYTAALVGMLAPAARRLKAISVAYTFTMLNVAAAKAFYNFLGGRTRWA